MALAAGISRRGAERGGSGILVGFPRLGGAYRRERIVGRCCGGGTEPGDLGASWDAWTPARVWHGAQPRWGCACGVRCHTVALLASLAPDRGGAVAPNGESSSRSRPSPSTARMGHPPPGRVRMRCLPRGRPLRRHGTRPRHLHLTHGQDDERLGSLAGHAERSRRAIFALLHAGGGDQEETGHAGRTPQRNTIPAPFVSEGLGVARDTAKQASSRTSP